ncbi:endonuclease/exonuclease/phosphatase family protein [Saccharopolyspora sp. HNM0983]|uniref:Endonuclease/exonuclease/phosphatase family protein n=1 Tax=Saccharopolyspora montiporae TaxID=2781240 RepID=A0A929B9W7_9PSEU|nr:endonuclease/exonuclease/phosphatase family protein [Saccharopolyspora sp. HNM0983]MBE9374126.1 endonuclease/exonuclease/phosphatase family protein [Saccharopolyspora sp. HNM0983]
MDQAVLAEPEQEQPPQGKPGGRVTTALLVLAALGLLGWIALPTAGADRGRYLIALTALTPYALVAGAVLALLALVLRRWLTALVVAALVAFLGVVVGQRAVPAEPEPTGQQQLRVLSLNAYLGRADARQVVDLVREHRVDVLSLQELTPEMVSELDGAGLGELLTHRVFDPGPDGSGSGLASRYPLRELDLVPDSTLSQPSARVSLPGGRQVDVVAVHPYYPVGPDTAADWERDMAALPEPPRGDAVPRVLAGDFNATLDHTELKELVGRGYADAGAATGRGLAPTWPARGDWLPPPVTIDHVLASDGIGVGGYEVFDVAGTDHRAVFADLHL